MKVLVACEESQRVCTAFREKGHEAYSCDLQPCSGGHPEWHIMQDAIPLLDGRCRFKTMDGIEHSIDGKWDLIIAHPPCTYLCSLGIVWFSEKYPVEKRIERKKNQEDAILFFMSFVTADCGKIALEYRVGIMSAQ